MEFNQSMPNESSFKAPPRLMSINLEDRRQTRIPRMVHVHYDRLEILQIRSGYGVHIIDGEVYETEKGDVLVYNAGVTHEEFADSKNGMDIFSCAVRNVLLQGQAPNVLFTNQYTPIISSKNCFREIGSLMFLLQQNFIRQHGSKEIESYLLYSLLLTLQKEVMKSGGKEEKRERVLGNLIQKYIDEHYKEDINLQDIADKMHLSQYYMSHVFKKIIGYSPKHYVIRRRIGEAQSYLLSTEKSVTEIAYLIGYNSASNFNNSFRKMVGMSPQKYRECWKTNHY